MMPYYVDLPEMRVMGEDGYIERSVQRLAVEILRVDAEGRYDFRAASGECYAGYGVELPIWDEADVQVTPEAAMIAQRAAETADTAEPELVELVERVAAVELTQLDMMDAMATIYEAAVLGVGDAAGEGGMI